MDRWQQALYAGFAGLTDWYESVYGAYVEEREVAPFNTDEAKARYAGFASVAEWKRAVE